MGTLFYGTGSDPVSIPDRLLGHVMTVAATKLRRGESFTLTWKHSTDGAPGRSTIWIQPSIPLRFVFDEAEQVPMDHALLRELAESASSSRGLMIDATSDSDAGVRRLDHARAA